MADVLGILMKSPNTLRALFLSAVLAAPLSLVAADDIYSKVDEPPVPVKTPPPRYPEALRRDGVSGLVAVTVVIDEKGIVISSEVSKSSHNEFEAPSIEAVKGWKFKPAKVGGNAVKVRVTIPMRFNVDG